MHVRLQSVTHYAVSQIHDFIRFPRVYNCVFNLVAATTALCIKFENLMTQSPALNMCSHKQRLAIVSSTVKRVDMATNDVH
jgi:hypothetical protein